MLAQRKTAQSALRTLCNASWLPQRQEEQPKPHQGLAASCDCDIYDVFLFVEFPELQILLVVVSGTCMAAA